MALAFTVAASLTPVLAATPTLTISAVGQLVTHTNQPAKTTESMSVAPGAAGDVLLLAIETKYPRTPAIAATAVTGGGVSSWSKVLSYASRDRLHGQELWWGVVTSTGRKTLKASFNSAATKGNSESATSLDVQEFRSSRGAATVWSVDGSGKVDTGVATKTPTYPTLAPSSGADAYFGYLAVNGPDRPGSTPGVVYQIDARWNEVAYALSVSASITPQGKSDSPLTFSSSGMLLKAR
jgi:hypothetical protein